LSHARHVSVAEDSKHPAEKLIPAPIALAVLNRQETDERLSHGQTLGSGHEVIS
jgi:hypothetical protein